MLNETQAVFFVVGQLLFYFWHDFARLFVFGSFCFLFLSYTNETILICMVLYNFSARGIFCCCPDVMFLKRKHFDNENRERNEQKRWSVYVSTTAQVTSTYM